MLRKCLCLLGQSHKLSKQHKISSWTTNVTINRSHSIALLLQHGHFNIPRFQTKVEAVQLNTLRRLMSGEDAHCKHFPGYLLRVSRMDCENKRLYLTSRQDKLNVTYRPFTVNYLSYGTNTSAYAHVFTFLTSHRTSSMNHSSIMIS